MVFEFFKEILDIENSIKQYGKFIPVYYFIYSSFITPSKQNLILIFLSLLLCIGIPKFDILLNKFRDNKKKIDVTKFYLKSNLLAFLFMVIICTIYLVFMWYAISNSIKDFLNFKEVNVLMLIPLFIIILGLGFLILFIGNTYVSAKKISKTVIKKYFKEKGKTVKKKLGEIND